MASSVDRHTPVKTLPCPRLPLRAVTRLVNYTDPNFLITIWQHLIVLIFIDVPGVARSVTHQILWRHWRILESVTRSTPELQPPQWMNQVSRTAPTYSAAKIKSFLLCAITFTEKASLKFFWGLIVHRKLNGTEYLEIHFSWANWILIDRQIILQDMYTYLYYVKLIKYLRNYILQRHT